MWIGLRDVELRGDALARRQARVRHRHQLAFGDAAERGDHHVAHVLTGADDPDADHTLLNAGSTGAKRRRHGQHAQSEKLATPDGGGVRAISVVYHAVSYLRSAICRASTLRVVSSVNESDSRGMLVTNGPTSHPRPNGIARVSEIASH